MSTGTAIRIGAVSYLNTAPLVAGLDQEPGMELSFDLPSRLADQLATGQLDVGLIPCIEFFQNPEYRVVSDACIACRGPVWSVMLLSRVPFESIKSLALDEGSRTSVALARILLRQRFGLSPSLHSMPMGQSAESTYTDAVLIIGDRAMHAPLADFPFQWDLGEQWCEWSGLSFVFAMWVARHNVDTSRVERALTEARDRGISQLEQIARREAPKLKLTDQQCLGYLRDNLHFYLGNRELAGLRRFRELAHQFALAPAISEPPWITEPEQGIMDESFQA